MFCESEEKSEVLRHRFDTKLSQMGKKNKKEHLSDGDESLSDSDIDPSNAKGKTSGEKKPKGIRWSAVFLLALFVVPAILGGAAYIYDLFYPEVRLVPKCDYLLITRDKIFRRRMLGNIGIKSLTVITSQILKK